MVSTQISSLSKVGGQKALQNRLLLSVVPPDSVPHEQEELDFSDVFGPITDRASVGANIESSNNMISEEFPKENVFDDPIIIHHRSHSLVGPTTRVSQALRIAKLTVHESEGSFDLEECISEEDATEASNDELETASVNDCDSVGLKKSVSVRLEDFEVLKLVGQGAFGKVYQVRKNGTSEIYAMKVMRKDKIMEKNHAEYMKAERDILTKVDHPFIVQLRYSFQTKYRLYLVLDFINGGHLFFQLFREGLFREDLARIYTAEIVSAVSHLHANGISHLHANGIMHRDLKPENILLDADGHAMLTDFGLAKQFEENTRSNSMCGTVEYMAPEIVLGKGHDKAADWWSVGVLLFEMLTGNPPFIGNRDKIQQKIIKDKIKLPSYLTSEAHSFLKGLLQKEASKRLGSGPGGTNEIKNHKWFKSINWKKLDCRGIQPSFRPNVAGQLCVANFEEKLTRMPLLDSPVGSPVGGACNFVGFSYVKPSPLRP